jgi:hypothetical protein
VEKFIDGQPQQVSIDQGHARNAPVLGARFNALINLFKIRQSTQRQPGGKFLSAGFEVSISEFRPEGARELITARSRNISRKEHLQGAFTRLTTRTHKIEAQAVVPALPGTPAGG